MLIRCQQKLLCSPHLLQLQLQHVPATRTFQQRHSACPCYSLRQRAETLYHQKQLSASNFELLASCSSHAVHSSISTPGPTPPSPPWPLYCSLFIPTHNAWQGCHVGQLLQ